MAFSSTDASFLRTLNYVVGNNSAIRLRYSITVIIQDDGSWYASHFRNNIRLTGKANNPSEAHKAARLALEAELLAVGDKQSAQQT